MHKAHFNGKYDASKSKLFMLLVDNANSWFSPREMHSILGVPVESLRWQCRRLHNARPPYLRRRRIGGLRFWNAYHYEYSLGQRGLRWYIHAMAAGLPHDRYLQEIRAWQESQKRANNGAQKIIGIAKNKRVARNLQKNRNDFNEVTRKWL